MYYNVYTYTIISGQNGYAADTSFSYNNGTTNLLENELNKRMSEQEQIKEKKAFMNAEKEYPPISKPSPSVQVIATRNRPCCDFQDQRAPVCLLFSIFLVVSVFVCCGVMLYIKSGIFENVYDLLSQWRFVRSIIKRASC